MADLVPLLLAILAILITLVVFFIYQRKRTLRRGVLLTGLCDSGKTLLFARLVHKNYVNTQTSIKENLGDLSFKNGSLKVIDIPGHDRLRYKYFDQYKSSAKVIAYVIDSITIQKDIRDVAEFLYNILTDPEIIKYSTQIIIVCNKQDLTLAKESKAIKSILERELNTLKVTKANQLDSVDPKGKKATTLGKDNAHFDFSSCALKVDFVETSNNKDVANIDKFEKLLEKAL